MNNKIKSHFKFDWVLVDKLAIGTVPKETRHLEKLNKEGIKGILNLCTEEEAKCIDNLKDIFAFKRVTLPDHRQKKLLTKKNIITALSELEKLNKLGPTFIHCFASMERSPIICMAWLMKNNEMDCYQALDYLMMVHKGTSPLAQQFNVLKSI
tara:strand:- start:39 stop:497 length:459 start_codon:yes stop_codon:yes gene_type:complete